MGRRFTCEMEPPRMKDGFSEATVVLDDGMRGGGGLVGRVVGSRTASGRLVITWCGAGCRTFKGKKKWFKIVNFTVRNTLLISAIPEFSHDIHNCKCEMRLRMNVSVSNFSFTWIKPIHIFRSHMVFVRPKYSTPCQTRAAELMLTSNYVCLAQANDNLSYSFLSLHRSPDVLPRGSQHYNPESGQTWPTIDGRPLYISRTLRHG